MRQRTLPRTTSHAARRASLRLITTVAGLVLLAGCALSDPKIDLLTGEPSPTQQVEQKAAEERVLAWQNPPDRWTEPTTGLTFVKAPAGCFTMGYDLGEPNNERPAHEVCLDPFWVATLEVSNAQFRLWRPEHDSGSAKGFSLDRDQHPAVMLSWLDAVNYAKWLNTLHPGRFDLPTEAQWEYAARAGGKSVRHWGETKELMCRYANISDPPAPTALKRGPGADYACNDGYLVSAPTGRFTPNDWGLYDTLGNVWEWTRDRFAPHYYLYSPRDNPVGPQSSPSRVVRGGSWRSKALDARASKRNDWSPKHRLDDVGFRLVWTP
ncbi:formylglycine-generating enzyme family protein [Magnetofaba australis]|uniref:formylglycine-generating enzyme family protein n=1 Tax=Magnetofaba australis TaxID=1472297 RepID=UPI000A19E332|nr:SUMF1/EgtB/PvdO family nonheme iron enzyme [Magnetofaba australis]